MRDETLDFMDAQEQLEEAIHTATRRLFFALDEKNWHIAITDEIYLRRVGLRSRLFGVRPLIAIQLERSVLGRSVWLGQDGKLYVHDGTKVVPWHKAYSRKQRNDAKDQLFTSLTATLHCVVLSESARTDLSETSL